MNTETPDPLIVICMESYVEALPLDITISLDGKDTRHVIAANEIEGWLDVSTSERRGEYLSVERRYGVVRVGGVTNAQRAVFVARYPSDRTLSSN